MKRLSTLLVLILVLSCVAPALAVDNVKGVKFRVNITMPAGKDHIYLYDEPSSSNGNNLGRIDNGEYVTGISSVDRKGYTWIYCDYNGIKGYIRKNNLVEVSGGSASGSSSSSSGSSSSKGGTYSSGTVSFTGDVNVRSGPGLDYDVIGSASRGQTLAYAGETRNDDRGIAWYSVTYNGRKGWVSSRYANLNGSSSGQSSPSSGGGDDQESALRKKLSNAVGSQLQYFGYADYDGDGNYEAFALVGDYDPDNFENMGELWYVSSSFVRVLENDGGAYPDGHRGYYPDESIITRLNGKKCFRLSEGYWGSGGKYRYWTVVNGSPYLYCEQGVWFSKGEIGSETYYDLP